MTSDKQPTKQERAASPSGSSDPLYNLDEVRRQAAQAAEKGAVTEQYPLDLKRAHALLNEVLASEILCVLRYRHHQVVASGINYPQVAAEFAEHAEAEERHMLAVAERIDQLGGDPDFNPSTVTTRASTQYGGTGSLREMIRADLVAERIAIDIYRRIVAWFGDSDPTSRRLMESILADEEEHANDLAALLESMKSH